MPDLLTKQFFEISSMSPNLCSVTSGFTASLQDQNKLTNDRAYAALAHLDYRHGERRFFCLTKSFRNVNSFRFTDLMNFDYHQTRLWI